MDIRRERIIKVAEAQLGDSYKLGTEVKMDDPDPNLWDCSEFVEWCYAQAGIKIPDLSANQFNFCKPIKTPLPGDLGFSSDEKGNISHVIMLYDSGRVIEARGKPFDKVMLREVARWEAFPRFKGWRCHPELLGDHNVNE